MLRLPLPNGFDRLNLRLTGVFTFRLKKGARKLFDTLEEKL